MVIFIHKLGEENVPSLVVEKSLTATVLLFFRNLPIFRSYLNLKFHVQAPSHPPNTEKTLTNRNTFAAEATNSWGL